LWKKLTNIGEVSFGLVRRIKENTIWLNGQEFADLKGKGV
jgi:hypothetical protein